MGGPHMCRWLSLGLLGLLAASGFADEPSVGWRYDGSGRYPAAEPPRAWSAEKNVLWKSAPVGRAISSVVVVDDYVFTTADTVLDVTTAARHLSWGSLKQRYR